MDLGFWSLSFVILDRLSLRSLCGGPKRARLDFGITTVCILHKIFPCQAGNIVGGVFLILTRPAQEDFKGGHETGRFRWRGFSYSPRWDEKTTFG